LDERCENCGSKKLEIAGEAKSNKISLTCENCGDTYSKEI